MEEGKVPNVKRTAIANVNAVHRRLDGADTQLGEDLLRTEVRRHGAAEVAIRDLRDEESLWRAMAGVDAVFYVAPAFLPDAEQTGK